MRFEWDETKNQTNIQKHGVSFETAKRIFDGPVLSRLDERRDYGEDRSISIGMVEGTAVLVIVYTVREGRFRLISARPASRKERLVYHEQIR